MGPYVLLAAYAAGILLASCVRPENITFPGIAAALLLSLWLPLRRSRCSWLPLTLAVLLAGYVSALLASSPPTDPHHISRFADNTTRIVEIRVVSIEPRITGGYRLLAEGRRIIAGREEALVRGRLQLTIESGTLAAVPGQIVRWRGKLRRPSRFGNLGEFDFPLHLAARGVFVTGFLKNAEDLAILANHPERRGAPLENLRLSIAARIAQAVPDATTGLVQSLLVGMRGGVSDQQRDILAESGVAHLFAISGLHFGLLALMLYQVGKWLYVRSSRLVLWCPPQRILPLLMIVPLAGYLLLTGDAWATRRAFLMASLAALLFAGNRRTAPQCLLATVALLILVCNPLAIFQPGFQLSFAGVAGILAWLPLWNRRLAAQPTLLRWPTAMVLTTAAATLATAPATLWHFHLLAPAGLLTNLVAIPLVAWGAVPSGLAGIALLPVSAPLADLALQLSAWLVARAVNLAAAISQWPGLQAVRLYLTPVDLVLTLGLVILVLQTPGVRTRQVRNRMLTLAAALTLLWFVRPVENGLRVVALSVGQGDATLVSLGRDDHYLVDGGGLPGTDFDPGERLIAPALGRLGVRRLKGVILTHDHPDHSSGLIYVLRHVQVEAFLTAVDPQELSWGLKKVLQERNIPIRHIDAGWLTIPRDDERIFALFSPHQESRDINERSVVVYAGDPRQGVLLTGDLGKPGFKQVLQAGIPGPVTLLKLPHHGSRLAAPGLFLERLAPGIAFVSAGRFNPYGFPHDETVAACTTRDVSLYRTDLQGMLTFTLRHDEWHAETGHKGFID